MTLNGKNIKLLVSDLDGTLLSSKSLIPPKNYEAIKQCQSKNISICLCSGRPTKLITKFAEELELSKCNGYIISYNGEVLTECQTNKIIYSSFLPSKTIKEIIEKYRSLNVAFSIIDNQTGNLIFEKVENNLSKFKRHAKLIVDDLTENIPENPASFCIYVDKDNLVELSEKIKKDFSVEVIKIISEGIQITKKNIDKANTIDVLRKKLGIDVSQICVIGDSENDITMIKYGGIGVAMGNACDECKKEADFVSIKNDEDGVAYALTKLGII